ncbi:MAG: flagellar assembly protein FliW [Spirochaetes bacterium]|nr:flagellar assembly protein FliW [Spirochaetota bacterium]
MKIQTKAYGEIELDERQRIEFPHGLLGFEKFKSYALLDAPQKPFLYLQSLDLAELAFVLIDPFLFRSDYTLDIADRDLAEIGLASPENAIVLSIVTVPADGSTVTANLMGPLVLNKANRLGVQAVLGDPRWQVKHDIMAELAKAGA